MNTTITTAMKRKLSYYIFALIMLSGMPGKAVAQIPTYNSYTAATAVLFLDFDGHTVDETVWNYNGPIFCGPSGLSTEKITEVFNRVSEDYRPFNINVTTDSLKFHAAPPDRRMRLILTVTSDWYGPAGGVAYVGSFAWGDVSPCFVFTALLNYNTKNISEAASHELGHTLGLFHQSVYDANCIKVSDYNYGTGSGEIGWAPIMGVGYYQNLTLWNNGPNPYGCSNYQSDLDIITQNNGFGFRVDDHGNTIAAATNAVFTGSQFTINGVVEKSTDSDIMKVIIPMKGRFELNAIPYNVGTGNAGSDLDMQVSLLYGSGATIRVYNPSVLLGAVIDTLLEPGTYYLRVEGRGNIYAPDYASLGSYSLQGRFTGGVLALHKLELRGMNRNEQHQLNWVIEADEQVTNLVLEYSPDGRHFEPLKELAPAERAYIYRPGANTTLLYRLSVTFDNGRHYYSNVVSLNGGDKSFPRLVNTFVTTGNLNISSPGQFEYTVFDMNGRAITRGRLSQGVSSVSLPFTSMGMYIIEFKNGNTTYTEKFTRK